MCIFAKSKHSLPSLPDPWAVLALPTLPTPANVSLLLLSGLPDLTEQVLQTVRSAIAPHTLKLFYITRSL